tara:strand:- start:1953 stop:2669 length:717 start_codon:yes stop_codon:yes gene_type:complete
MALISTYPIDQNIVGSDKWIGSDANFKNATKNFSVDKVAEYLNNSASIQSQTLRYQYQATVDSLNPRKSGTVSFQSNIGDEVAFSSISSWLLSRYSIPSKDVYPFYTNPLIGSTVLVTNANDITNWAVYKWESSVEDESNFYNIGLEYVSGSGGLEDGEYYLISLLLYDIESNTDKTFTFPQNVASDTWSVTHNLNKFPSVSVVDSGNTAVLGSVNYINNNELTITFSAPFSGYAYMN